MAEIGPITLLMLQHHAVVNKFLSNFEKISEKDSWKMKDSFRIFKWNLEKHFFIEEANFFVVADKDNRTELSQLNNLLKDHKDLMIVLNNLNEDLDRGKKPVTGILKELLFAHERRETDSFYPMLDKRLSEKEKKEIIKKASDIILG
ncbi:MAG: hemerythrin domain-containing protein [Nanoarchaeota archaeon]